MLEYFRQLIIKFFIKPEDIHLFDKKVHYNLEQLKNILPPEELLKTDQAKMIIINKMIKLCTSYHGINNDDTLPQKNILFYQEELSKIKYRILNTAAKDTRDPTKLELKINKWREQILSGNIDLFCKETIKQLEDNSILFNENILLLTRYYNLEKERNKGVLSNFNYCQILFEVQFSGLELVNSVHAYLLKENIQL